MFEEIRRYFVNGSQAIIRHGAVMSKREATRNKFLAITSPFLLLLVIFIEISEPSKTLARELIVWWLAAMLALASVSLPMALYGYRNRDRIDTEGVDPINYGAGVRGALLGTAMVPLGRMLFNYFGIN